MKHIVLFILATFAFGLNAQNVVSGSKSFTFSKKEIKENKLQFELVNTTNEPFVTLDLRINNKVNKETKVYIQYEFEDYNEAGWVQKNLVKYEWETDIHFDNDNTWNSTLEFLPVSAKNINVIFENLGNKMSTVDVNFFYPGKTENLAENAVIKAKAISSPTPVGAAAEDCACAIPAYQSRADWDPAGTHPVQINPTYTAVTHLIVHHAAGPNTSSDWAATVRGIWNFHVNSRGWSDIGYNYLIAPNGVIYEGRGNNVMGAHFSGQNSGTMGVCLLGNYQPSSSENVSPSIAIQNSLIELLSWKECDISKDPLTSSYHAASAQTQMHISGHRDGGGTSCPGDNVYNLLPNIRNACSSYMNTCSFAPNADLVVSSLTTSPTNVILGANTTLKVAVGNGGNTKVLETINVNLKVDGVLVQTFVLDSINAGQILNFSQPNFQFTSIGNHQICVYIDSASSEINIANNSYCKTINVADSTIIASDLSLTNIALSNATPTVSETITFDADIQNIGPGASSESVQARIFIDGELIQIFTVPVIANAQSELKTFNYSFNKAGEHTVCLEINSPTNELNTVNNSSCKTFEVSPKNVGINDLASNIESLYVFPNPVKDVLNISLELEENSETNLSLLNALGQKVWSKDLGNNNKFKQEINVAKYAKGIYFLSIQTSVSVYTQQVILE